MASLNTRDIDLGAAGTITPLPQNHRNGLTAVAVMGALSFTSTTTLFLFLTYKLLTSPPARAQSTGTPHMFVPCRHEQPNAMLGLPREICPFCRGEGHIQVPIPEASEVPSTATGDIRLEKERTRRRGRRRAKSSSQKPFNPFPILIYNLLFADIQESLGYALNTKWVAADGLWTPSTTCFAQGWLNSTGNLAAGVFLSAISLSTYLVVIRGKKLERRTFYICVSAVWVFVYTISSAGIIITGNGRDVGGWYVRANAWCWINHAYERSRLYTHYIWIISSEILTTIMHFLVCYKLHREHRSPRELPPHLVSDEFPRATTDEDFNCGLEALSASRSAATANSDTGEAMFSFQDRLENQRRDSGSSRQLRHQPSGFHPAFLIYPLVFLVFTAPIGIIRVLSMSGIQVDVSVYCWAGAMIASNGLFNSILWTSTILFSAQRDISDSGLDRFAFTKTPLSWGNNITIEGPSMPSTKRDTITTTTTDWIGGRYGSGGFGAGGGSSTAHGGEWWWWRQGGQTKWDNTPVAQYFPQLTSPSSSRGASRSGPRGLHRGSSEESLRGGERSSERGIQLDVVTSVTVEQISNDFARLSECFDFTHKNDID